MYKEFPAVERRLFLAVSMENTAKEDFDHVQFRIHLVRRTDAVCFWWCSGHAFGMQIPEEKG